MFESSVKPDITVHSYSIKSRHFGLWSVMFANSYDGIAKFAMNCKSPPSLPCGLFMIIALALLMCILYNHIRFEWCLNQVIVGQLFAKTVSDINIWPYTNHYMITKSICHVDEPLQELTCLLILELGIDCTLLGILHMDYHHQRKKLKLIAAKLLGSVG